MKLETLLTGVNVTAKRLHTDTVTAMTSDSRRVAKGTMFLCVRGLTHDGHDYAAEAVEKGAVVVVCEDISCVPEGCDYIQCENTRLAEALLWNNWFGRPAYGMLSIAVTGTGGKTSVVYILKHILEKGGHTVGCVTTIAAMAGDKILSVGEHGGSSVEDTAGAMTTPDPEYFYGAIAMMRQYGCDTFVYEASSHGLDLRKTDGVKPKIAVFTNLAHEHLDYHGTMDRYLAAKARLFSSMGAEIGICNADDPYCGELMRLAGEIPDNPIRFITCGAGTDWTRNVSAMRLTDHGAEGISFLYCADDVIFRLKTPLVGKYSVYNTMEAACAALQCGVDPLTVKDALADMPCVPGRMQRLMLENIPFTVFLDYAHTPAALTSVLETALVMNPERLTVVFGCGGDRDRGKRPLMGQAAQKFAHRVIITGDNPRSEDPMSIIADITAGMEETLPYEVIPDRRQAILHCIRTAVAGEIILLCGKGHEKYEIRDGAKIPFDEEAIVREAAAGLEISGEHELE